MPGGCILYCIGQISDMRHTGGYMYMFYHTICLYCTAVACDSIQRSCFCPKNILHSCMHYTQCQIKVRNELCFGQSQGQVRTRVRVVLGLGLARVRVCTHHKVARDTIAQDQVKHSHSGVLSCSIQCEDLQKGNTKTTAPRIPAWSPTVVLTERHSG